MYIDTIVIRFGMEDSKKGFIPKRHGLQISEDSLLTLKDRTLMEKILYASVNGSIMYVVLCTRPDEAFTLSVRSRFQVNPGERQWEAVKCIVEYLRRTKDLFMIYGGEELKLQGYTDSSFQSDPNDSRSTSRFIFTSNGGSVSWKGDNMHI